MRYLPKSPAERQEMLAAIGAKSIDELFSGIPERYRLRAPLKIPGPYSEAEVIQYFSDRAAENSAGYTSFLGAGVYNHLRSVVTDAIIQRGEFLTSYTPYQAEIAQGTLQAIFEFQTLMCQLTGQEVANASMYDGSTATTEAVLMAERLTGRQRVLVARSVHPEYREVLKTYAKNSGLRVEEIPFTANGTVDAKALQGALKDDVAAVVVQSPNFFGVIESYAPLAELLKVPGIRRSFDAPFFNEFTVELPRSVKMVNAQLLRERIIGPLALGTPYPELTKHALVCVTETTPRGEIERFAGALKRALEQPI